MRALLFLRVYFSLIYFDLILRRNGFAKTFEIYVNRHAIRFTGTEYTYSVDRDKIIQLLETIDKACALFPLKAQCMHRSFLGFKYCRKLYGLPVELVIGVKKFPFYAHAWLRHQSHNLNEMEEVTNNLQIILSSREGGKL